MTVTAAFELRFLRVYREKNNLNDTHDPHKCLKSLNKEAGIGSEGWLFSFLVALIGIEDEGGIYVG